MHKIIFISFGLFFSLATSAQQAALPSGSWRGELKRQDGQNIVVNFDIAYKDDKPVVYIRNASEKLEADDISFSGDSVFIKLPFFDSQFRLAASGNNVLEGTWRKTLADRDVVMPFRAVNNQNYRFKTRSKLPTAKVAGRWDVTFIDTITVRNYKAVGVFEQQGKKLTGSFLTPSGDYRYLEGVVDGDSLKLSGFDGGYALLFLAKVDKNNTITGGRYYSGSGPATRIWNAKKDPAAKLPDASAATHVKEGMQPRFDFTFKDVDGNPVSIKDDRFKNKVVIVQILGSWCPNCLDETRFMTELYQEYHDKGLEVIGLAYERTTDFARSQAAVKNFMKRLQVSYPVLITPVAVSDAQRAEKTLPQLESIPAFPTTIFIDRKGEIQFIHAGFNGPGTGEDYNKQKEEYYQIVNDLLSK